MAKRRRLKRLFVGVVVLVVIAAAGVLLLPALAGTAFGRSLVAGTIEQRVQGTASIDALELRWRGPQSIRGLRIIDASGVEAMALDATTPAGLLGLARGPERLAVEVRGRLAGSLREDGSTSFTDLVRPRAPGDADEPAPPGGEASAAPLAGVPALRVDVGGLEIELTLEGEGSTLVLDGVTGHVAHVPGGTSEIDLETATTAGDLRGSMQLAVTATQLFDAAGRLVPARAGLDAHLTLVSVPVPFAEQVDELTRLELTARGQDLSEQLDLAVRGGAILAGEPPSTLEGAFVLRRPVRADGRLDVGVGALSGELEGRRVPTVLFQPFLSATPILLSRDLGPSVDADVRVEPASADGAGAARRVRLALTAAEASLEVDGAVDEAGAVTGRDARATLRLQPALAAALLGVTIEAPAALRADLASFTVPAFTGERPFALGDVAVRGSVVTDGAIAVRFAPDAGERFVAEAVRAEVESPRLADALRLRVTAQVDGGRVELDETITGLVGADGELTPRAMEPVGTLTASGFDGERLLMLLPEDARTPLVSALLVGRLGADVTTARGETGLNAAIAATTETLRVEASARRAGERVTVADTRVTLALTPAVVAALAGDEVTVVGPGAGPAAEVRLEPIELDGADLASGLPDGTTLRGRLTLDEAWLRHPSLAEAAGLDDLRGDFSITTGADSVLRLEGDAGVFRTTAARAPVARIRYDLTARKRGDTFAPTGDVALASIEVAALAPLLGREPDELVDLLGAAGDVRLRLAEAGSGTSGTVTSTLPALSGTATAALDGGVLELASDGLALTLTPSFLERRFNAEATAPPASPGPSSRVRVPAPLPLRLAVNRLRLPMAAIEGEPFDPASAEVDVTLTGGPLQLADGAGVFSSLRDLSVTVRSSDLAGGVGLVVRGTATGRGASEPGIIDAAGRAVNLLTDDRRLDLAGMMIDLDINARGVPTVIADTLMGFDGLLAAAVGPQMAARFESERFSASTGWLEGRLETTNGFIEGRLEGGEAAFRTNPAKPVTGELAFTPPLRDRLLASIHPLLGDVRTVEKAVRFAAPGGLVLPADGDLSRLDGSLRIDIGAVEIDSGSSLLGLLRLFDESPRPTVSGSIEPILVDISRGVVTYDRFAVAIDRYTLVYSGSVDLVQKRIDLRTELPLAALAMRVEELKGYVDKISVPIVTRGTFGSTKTEIDPKFDLGKAAIDAGFRGALNDLLKDKGIPLGDILGDIFGGGKKK